ncbi:MAG: Export membrane protein SecD, partial [Candidatus Woesebacteria bacterium GW2011_GWB1_38_5]
MNWLKHIKIYFILSGVLLVISITSLFLWRLKLGIDFTGGALIEYKFSKEMDDTNIYDIFEEAGAENISFELSNDYKYLIKTNSLSTETKNQIDSELKNEDENYIELKYELVGPSIGPELVQKTIYAIILSAFVILLWVAYQFKNLRYGLSAVLAMFHDSIILLGSFSLLG